MSAFDQMIRQLAVVCDLFSQVRPDKLDASGSLVDELSAEEFDPATINEANRVLTTTAAARDATELASLSAQPLSAHLEQL